LLTNKVVYIFDNRQYNKIVLSAGSRSIMHTKKSQKNPVTLTFDLWPWNSLGFVRLPRNMFTQDFIVLSASGSRVIVRTEKKQYSDENNTVRRHRADSKNIE